MKKISVFLSASLLAMSVQAADVAGVDVPEEIKTVPAQPLKLNGAGVREKWMMDLYVGALYLKQHESDAVKIIKDENAMAIRLQIVSGMITSERMTSSTLEGFEHATHGNTAPIQKEIDAFLATFKEPIKEGDVFEMVYVPNEGVKIFKNNELKNTVVGAEFKQALFGIWLSDEPAQKSLKDEMLGSKS
ncbi:MAG TPA: chalcone isomerase family protein [Dongiaceae bacterium]|nr:chalcone isomerase family protein [Dongiaceae bacterium]